MILKQITIAEAERDLEIWKRIFCQSIQARKDFNRIFKITGRGGYGDMAENNRNTIRTAKRKIRELKRYLGK